MTYCPEGGGESSLQLSDPAATEATLTDLQCNISYTITVVAIAGEHKREGVAEFPLTLEGTVLLCVYRTGRLYYHSRETFQSLVNSDCVTESNCTDLLDLCCTNESHDHMLKETVTPISWFI